MLGVQTLILTHVGKSKSFLIINILAVKDSSLVKKKKRWKGIILTVMIGLGGVSCELENTMTS